MLFEKPLRNEVVRNILRRLRLLRDFFYQGTFRLGRFAHTVIQIIRDLPAFRFAVDIAAYYNCSCQTY